MSNLVFNDLSVDIAVLPVKDIDAIKYFRQLNDLLIAYRKQYKFSNAGILSAKPFKQYAFTSEGTDLRLLWNELPQDTKNILIQAITQHPLIERKIPPYYYFNDQDALGFAYAYEQELFTISYNNDVWNEVAYELQKNTEVEDLIYEEIVLVNHFVKNKNDINSVEDDFYNTLKNSNDIWDRISDIFPHLRFCGDTEKQICGYSINSKHLRTIYNKLSVLNEGLSAVPFHEFDYSTLGIKISGESESTLNQFSAERTFNISNTDRNEVFENHIKLPDIRIHFFLDKSTEACYIGYIGKHLRTATNK